MRISVVKNTQLACSFTKLYFCNFPDLACMVKGELLFKKFGANTFQLFPDDIRRGNSCPVCL